MSTTARILLLLGLVAWGCGRTSETNDRRGTSVPSKPDDSMPASACENDREPCVGTCNSNGFCEQNLGWGPEVRVPAGTYVAYVRTGRLAMGKAEQSLVTFPSPFWIAKLETSNQQARRCEICTVKADAADEMPTLLPRAQAEAYCAASGRRLPTNHEWEAAGRGPATCDDPELIRPFGKQCNERYFPWGHSYDDFCTKALIGDCGKEGPRPVGEWPAGASPLGVHDLIGNVDEWISDMEKDEGLVKGGDWSMPGDEWMYSAVTLIARSRAKVDELHGVRCVRGPVMNPEPRLKASPFR